MSTLVANQFQSVLPWSSSEKENKRFNKITWIVLAMTVSLALVVKWQQLPEQTRAEKEKLPPQLTRIIEAQKVLPTVEIDYDLRVKISEVCSQLDVDGLRGDIVTNRAAKAHAAYNGRDKVTVHDIQKIITLCLRHRLRKDPLEAIDSGDKVNKIFTEIFEIDE